MATAFLFRRISATFLFQLQLLHSYSSSPSTSPLFDSGFHALATLITGFLGSGKGSGQVYTARSCRRRPSGASPAASTPNPPKLILGENFYPVFRKYHKIFGLILSLMMLPMLFYQPVQYVKPEPPIHLRLVYQWPGTLCVLDPCPGAPFGPHRFTVHGLWPHIGASPIKNCPSDWRTEEIQPLMGQLDFIWPDYYRESNVDFWVRQWYTHGSCTVFDQRSYFQTVINLNNNLPPLLLVLNAGGIFPNLQPQSHPAILTAILQINAFYPLLRCRFANGVPYLVEIVLCFDEHANDQVHCNYLESNCPLVFVL